MGQQGGGATPHAPCTTHTQGSVASHPHRRRQPHGCDLEQLGSMGGCSPVQREVAWEGRGGGRTQPPLFLQKKRNLSGRRNVTCIVIYCNILWFFFAGCVLIQTSCVCGCVEGIVRECFMAAILPKFWGVARGVVKELCWHPSFDLGGRLMHFLKMSIKP